MEPNNHAEALLLKNIKTDVSNFLQLRLPILKACQQRISKLEFDGLVSAYFLLSCIEHDMRSQPAVWATFGKAFDLCAQRLRSELEWFSGQAGLTVVSFQARLDEMQDAIQSPERKNDIMGMPVGTVIRKVAEKLRAMQKSLRKRGIEAPIATETLGYLAQNLEEIYDKSVSYSNWKSAK